MQNLNVIATELFNKIRGRFPTVTLGDEESNVTSEPEQARYFDFDFVSEGRPVGKISVSLDGTHLAVVYGKDLMTNENEITKGKWYDFLKELRMFAKKRMMSFDTRDITKSNLDTRDYKFLAKNRSGDQTMSESKLYGTSTRSYQNIGTSRLVLRHSQPVNPELSSSRSQHVESIYIESNDGERFKYPFKHINGARAMARHVSEGGKPFDDFGQHITGLSEELYKLRKFKSYMGRSSVMAESLADYMGIVNERIQTVKKTVERLQKETHYAEAVDGFEKPVFEEVPNDVRENWIDELTIKQFNEELADVFPYIYNLVKEGTRAQELGPEEIVDEAYAVEYRDPEGKFKVLYDYDKRGYVAIGHGEYKDNIEPQWFDKLDHAVEHAEEELRLDGAYDDQDMEEAGKLQGGEDDPCWKGYKMVGTKKKGGKEVPNCVPEEAELELAFERAMGQFAEDDAASPFKKGEIVKYTGQNAKSLGSTVIYRNPSTQKPGEHWIDTTGGPWSVSADELQALNGKTVPIPAGGFDADAVKKIVGVDAPEAPFKKGEIVKYAGSMQLGDTVIYRRPDARNPSKHWVDTTSGPFTVSADELAQLNGKTIPIPDGGLDSDAVKKALGATEDNDTIDVKMTPDGGIEKADAAEKKTPIGEFILSYFDRETGEFPKGETAVLTMIEKDYGEEYIEPAKKFIEQVYQVTEQFREPSISPEMERMRELAGLR